VSGYLKLFFHPGLCLHIVTRKVFKSARKEFCLSQNQVNVASAPPSRDFHQHSKKMLFQFLCMVGLYCYGCTATPTTTSSPLTSLTWNYKRDVNLTYGMFSNYRNLRQLKLSYNTKILYVQSGAFSGLPLLESLELSYNTFLKIESGAFSGMPSLKRFILRYNDFEIFPTDMFKNLTS
ncbi:unnamed protein product, partial [Owenia fusiformis]